MSPGRVIKVECQCDYLLFKYYKGGRGRLVKCFLDQLTEDNVGIEALPLGTRPTCPTCEKVIGEIRIVRGRPAIKLNQGAIKPIRT